MSADNVYGALVDYVKSSLGTEVWLEIIPEQTTATERALPYVAVEGDIDRVWTFEAKYLDTGMVKLKCYAVGDTAAGSLGARVLALFANPDSWAGIPIQGAKFVEASVKKHGLHEDENTDQDANVVYMFYVDLDVVVTGGY